MSELAELRHCEERLSLALEAAQDACASSPRGTIRRLYGAICKAGVS